MQQLELHLQTYNYFTIEMGKYLCDEKHLHRSKEDQRNCNEKNRLIKKRVIHSKIIHKFEGEAPGVAL